MIIFRWFPKQRSFTDIWKNSMSFAKQRRHSAIPTRLANISGSLSRIWKELADPACVGVWSPDCWIGTQVFVDRFRARIQKNELTKKTWLGEREKRESERLARERERDEERGGGWGKNETRKRFGHLANEARLRRFRHTRQLFICRIRQYEPLPRSFNSLFPIFFFLSLLFFCLERHTMEKDVKNVTHLASSTKTNFRSLRSLKTTPFWWHIATAFAAWRKSRLASGSRNLLRARTYACRSPWWPSSRR